MFTKPNRRTFIKTAAGVALGTGIVSLDCQSEKEKAPLFKISLAEWSLHNAIFGGSIQKLGWEKWAQALRSDYESCLAGTLDNLDFPVITRKEFDIDAVEYVNTFFFDKARNKTYLKELKKRSDDNGIYNNLIMCDQEGRLGDPDDAARAQAVENHHKWVEAAAFLGCRHIRVNAASSGSYKEQQKLAADGLYQLAEYGDRYNINVIVENHGGLSSNGQWLTGVIELADHPRLGTLPDFGNFKIKDDPEEWYDRYQGVKEMMPYAKAVSAKSYDFDSSGNDTRTDYFKMMRIVLDAGYRDYVGIEYEGSNLAEYEGIRATKLLLEKVAEKLRPEYT